MSAEQSLQPIEDFETGMAFLRCQFEGADENGYACVHKLTTEIGLPWDSAYEEEVTALARAAHRVWSRLTHDPEEE